MEYTFDDFNEYMAEIDGVFGLLFDFKAELPQLKQKAIVKKKKKF